MSEEMYPQELIDEYYNAIQELHEALNDKDEQITDLLHEKEIIEIAFKLACERVRYFEEMQDKEMGFYDFFGYESNYDLVAIIKQYKQQAKEMLENENIC